MSTNTAAPPRPFVGRQRELGELSDAASEAASGCGRLFVVTGEAGIGKTRLVEEAAAFASATGARVLWGRCWPGGGAPAFWPWTQVIRALGEEFAPVEPAAQTADLARFQLFDRIATFVRSAAERTPLLLAFDELEAADEPSLRLLEFVARDLRGARMLILATCRDREEPGTSSAVRLAAHLAREGGTVPLRGLSESEIAEYVAQAGIDGAMNLAPALQRFTGGNPFFLGEMVRRFASEGVPDHVKGKGALAIPVPDRLREAMRGLLRDLPERVRAMLSVCAVVGREFDVALVARVFGCGTHEGHEILDEARRRGVVTGVGTIGRAAFAHGLLREAIYDDVDPIRRAELHREVAAVLEVVHAADLDAHLSELAHHQFRAMPVAGPRKAHEYARQAGERALAQLGYEEAVLQYERARAAMEPSSPPGERSDAEIALGVALWRAARPDAARAAYERAADLARAASDGRRLAVAALGSGDAQPETGRPDESLIALLEEAIERLPPAEAALRARLLARLATALLFTTEERRRHALAEDAVAVARRSRNDAALSSALIAQHMVLAGIGEPAAQMEMAREMLEIAERSGSAPQALEARAWLIRDLLELGDVERADGEIRRYAADATKLRLPRSLWFAKLLEAMRALLRGDFAAAERLAEGALAVGSAEGNANATQFFAIQIFTLRREQGRLAELEPAVSALAESHRAIPAWRCGRALIAAETGRHDDARRELDELAAGEFSAIPALINRVDTLAILAEVSAECGAAEHAGRLYELLEPFAGRNVVLGTSVACWGSVERYLGLLAASLGRFEEAARRFENAIAWHRRIGARPWLARTEYDYARMLARPGSAGDLERAQELLGNARTTAGELGMTSLAEKIRALEVAVPTPTTAAPSIGSEPPSACMFRREGEAWAIAYAGTRSRLEGSKGFAYLALLLAHPEREFHVLELAADHAEQGSRARIGEGVDGRAAGLGDAGGRLDARAKAEYRRRLEELGEELEEAEHWNDRGRVERARAEIEAISRELASSVGLGGRDRKAASAAERARVAVTKRIRTAIKRVAEANPALGRHLAKAVHTGTFCSYSGAAGGGTIDWQTR